MMKSRTAQASRANMASWIALCLVGLSIVSYGTILVTPMASVGTAFATNAIIQLGLVIAYSVARQGRGGLAGAIIIAVNSLALYGLLFQIGQFAPPAYLLVVGTVIGTWTLPPGWLAATTAALAVTTPTFCWLMLDVGHDDVEGVVLLTILLVVTGSAGVVGAWEWDRLYTVDEARRRALEATALRAARMKAQNEAQSAFLTSMSHELRTPLNAILGYVELVAEEIADVAPRSVTDLERAGVAGRHLRDLIDDVLDLSKLEAGKLSIEDETVAIAPLLHDVAAASQALADARANRLVLEAPPAVTVRGDELRLRQVLLNLVSNSAKFTEQGTITLRAVAAPDAVAIIVTDSGRGMTEAELAKAFQRFGQVERRAPVEGGTGLGLTMARELTLAMGGHLDATSRPGHGTTITVRLRPGA